MAIKAIFCKFQLGEGVYAILRKWAWTYKMTRILPATHPTLLNLQAIKV